MRPRLRRAAAAALLLGAARLAQAGGWSQGYGLDESLPIGLEEDLIRERSVARGVEQGQAYLGEEPWFINWVEIDTLDPALRFRVMKGEDRVEGNETLSSLVARAGDATWQPIAAINGDFWHGGGSPVGLCVQDQRLLSLRPGRPGIARTVSGQWHVGRFTFRAEFVAEGETFPLADVNTAADTAASDEVIVAYTRDWGAWPLESLTVERDWAAVGLLNPEGLTVNVNATATGALIPVNADMLRSGWPEGLVLVVGFGAHAADIRDLSFGGSARITIACEQFGEEVEWALGGGPVLLEGGEVVVSRAGEPGFRPSFITDRHPRTAVGLDQHGRNMVLMVVDGRQPGLSAGMDLFQVADWMRARGMWTAINLDGGGSSTIWVRGTVHNSPSDGEERPVTNALVVLSRLRGEELAHMELLPRDMTLPLGLIPPLAVSCYDAGWNPIEFDAARLRWAATVAGRGPDPRGFPDRAQADFFDAAFRVEADNGVWAESRVHFAPIARWEIIPDPLQLASGEEVAVRIRALDASGERIQIPRRSVDLSVDPPHVARLSRDEEDRLVVRGTAHGTASLVVRWSEAEGSGRWLWAAPPTPEAAAFPLTVGEWRRVTVEGFEASAEVPSLRLTLFEEAATRVAWTSDVAAEGARALSMDYAMRRGGTSAAYLTLNTPLPEGARAVGLEVYGDGGAAWLRGEVTDRDGEKFLLDFTGSRGITWRDEWRWVDADITRPRPHWENPTARADPPLTLSTLYLAQGQEAAKTSGRVVFDAVGVEVFEAVSP